MTYNPIFEEEISREKELNDLRGAIKLRAGSDKVLDLCHKFSNFVKAHPIFTTLALGVFGANLGRKRN